MKPVIAFVIAIFFFVFPQACQPADRAHTEAGTNFFRQVQNAGSIEAERRLDSRVAIDGTYDLPLSNDAASRSGLWLLAGDRDIWHSLAEARKKGGWKDGWDALMWAAFIGNAQLIPRIIHAGADLNAQDPFGNTALMIAARQGHYDAVIVLIHAGANLNVRDWYGNTVMTHAVDSYSQAIVSALIDRDMDPNAHNYAGQTPFMEACDSGDVALIQYLLDHGAVASQKDDYGQTAAQVIAERQRLQTLYGIPRGKSK